MVKVFGDLSELKDFTRLYLSRIYGKVPKYRSDQMSFLVKIDVLSQFLVKRGGIERGGKSIKKSSEYE